MRQEEEYLIKTIATYGAGKKSLRKKRNEVGRRVHEAIGNEPCLIENQTKHEHNKTPRASEQYPARRPATRSLRPNYLYHTDTDTINTTPRKG